MRAVDTNVIVRLLVRDDVRQAETADRFIQDGAWVPLLALAETTWVLECVYQRTPRQIAQAVEMLTRHERLTLQDEDAIIAALESYRARPSLGFSDCLMLELARKTGHLPLGTFDRGLAKVAGAQKL